MNSKTNKDHELWKLVPGADNSSLPQDVFIRFQAIKLQGDGCSSNYRFMLFKDGRFFLQENKNKDCHLRPKGTRFNLPYSLKPLKILKQKNLNRIISILENQKFITLKEVFRPEEKVFDGSVQIMEYSYGKQQLKRVISFQSSSKEIETIMEAIWKEIY